MSTTQHYPLEDVRVLDFSRVVAGPFAGRLLTDLGADVVKVEPPEGDSTRTPGRKVRGISGFFNQQNAGKRNICLDLRAEGAPELVKKLVAAADIVIENYRPGVMQRLGIDYATLAAANPRLVYASITGYGRDSSLSDRPGHDALVAARVGLHWEQRGRVGGSAPALSGREPFAPEHEVPRAKYPVVDFHGHPPNLSDPASCAKSSSRWTG